MGPIKKIKQLVIDSGAFLKNVAIWDYGEEFFTVQDVVYEIRDKQAKDFINSLPFQLNFREPSPAAIKFIKDFTEKTGELRSLSLVDIKVLALTYELEVEAKGTSDHLRNEPVQRKPVVDTSRRPVLSQVEGFYAPPSHRTPNNQDKMETESNTSTLEFSDSADSEDHTNISTTSNITSVTEAVSSLSISATSNAPSVTGVAESVTSLDISQQNNNNDEETLECDEGDDDGDNDDIGDDDGDDDNEGWITPSNIKAIKGRNGSVCENDYKDVEVACITSDFAVQNTLLHIGLSTIGVDGRLIKSLRMYILKCFVCHTLTSDMEKRFCKKCGYKTLKKVSYTLNPDGTKHIWVSNRPINTRGMKYSLPAPQGGKRAVNPILCADQRVPQMLPNKRNRQRNDPMHEDYLSTGGRDKPFRHIDTSGRFSSMLANNCGFSFQMSKQRGIFYFEKKNPNDPGKNVKRRKR
ncbi:UNVERIFIED_CONTAM: hypothetical protein RMT77_003280 [Armadillidium vulgare]